MRPISAFLIVDVQNDFITGSLAISNCAAQHNGNDVISTETILNSNLSKVLILFKGMFYDFFLFADNPTDKSNSQQH